ncbi:MAG: hypothetical protein AB7O67_03275 [Vicinamibacterales bacterium]
MFIASTRARRTAGLTVWMLAASTLAWAQAGPTGELPDEAPTEVQYRLGPVILNPNIELPAIGVDTNVFDDPEDPKQDWMASLQPDIVAFVQPGLFTVAIKSGSTFTYYHKYHSERSISQDLRGKVSIRLSRFRPWIGGATVQAADRPSPEIDARARRTEREASAGVSFALTPIADVVAYASRIDTRFDAGETYQDVDLVQALDRRNETASIGLRMRLTPFTTVHVRGEVARDRFLHQPSRDGRTTNGEVQLSFSPEAIIRGDATVGWESYEPERSDVGRFRGVHGRVGLTAVGYWRGVFQVNATRGVQYSYLESDDYYLETGVDMTYTQRIGGPFDVQVRGARTWLSYDVSQPGGRVDGLNSYQAGIGFNLQNNSRIGFNYEYTERQSDVRADRRYARRRFFGSYSYEFWK